jgi:hypothetical protein
MSTSGLKKISTNMMVNEITEIENDESPNRKKDNRFDYQNSMGFKPEEGSHRNFTLSVEDVVPKEPYSSRGFEQDTGMLPLNITYNKTDKVFGVTSNMHQRETQHNSF